MSASEDQPIKIGVTPTKTILLMYHRARPLKPFVVSMPREEFLALIAFFQSVPAHCRSEGFIGFTPEQIALHGLRLSPLPEHAENS